MGLACTSVLMVERASINGSHLCLCPPRESQLPLASPGGSQRSTSGFNTISFQITAPTLGLESCEIFHVLYKNRVSVSYSPPTLPYTSPTGLPCQAFWGLIILV